MGAIRSAYSCPVLWAQGQEEPDTMFWYFAEKCARLFPLRHSFQTHYQYDDFPDLVDVGEQPGLRTYSKGFGPIGAPHNGLTWLGTPEEFTDGVSPHGPPPVADCPTYLNLGHRALLATHNILGLDDVQLGQFGVLASMDPVGVVRWENHDNGVRVGDIDFAIWDGSSGEMVLTVGVVETIDPKGVLVKTLPFDFLEDTGLTWIWHYIPPALQIPPFPTTVFVEQDKCIP